MEASPARSPGHQNSDPAGASDPTHGQDEISFVEVVNVLLRRRRLIILLPLALALAVGSFSLTRSRYYSAGAVFLPEASLNRQTSGAASLAQQFGISLGGQPVGQSLDFYAELLRGRTLLRGLVETEFLVQNPEGGPGRRQTLIDYYEAEPNGIVPAWQAAIESVRSHLGVQTDAATGSVSFTFQDTDPALAEQVVTRLLELLNQFNVEQRQSQAAEEGRFVSERLEEATAELRAAEEELKRFLSNNKSFAGSAELQFEHDRLQRAVALRQEVVASLSQSLERARIDAVRDTPVLTIVASPEESARPVPRGTVLKALVAFVAGVVFACFLALLAELGRRMRAELPDQYEEFAKLRAETLEDLRRPLRFFRRSDRPRVAARN